MVVHVWAKASIVLQTPNDDIQLEIIIIEIQLFQFSLQLFRCQI